LHRDDYAASRSAIILLSHGYTDKFRDGYLLPMGAAIWSMSVKAMMEFPAESFVAFFNNHHLLAWDRPVWRTVKGGSRVYVERMIRAYKDRLRLNAEGSCESPVMILA